MSHVIVLLIGLLCGAGAFAAMYWLRWRQVTEQGRQQATKEKTLQVQQRRLTDLETELRAHKVSYDELFDESQILKHDLQNVDVNLRKLELDRDVQQRHQDEIDAQVKDVGKRYLSENVTWIGKTLTPNNFAACKKRLQDVISRCRGIDFSVTEAEEVELHAKLKADFEKAVRVAFEREEQARIKAQIREEQKLEREVQKELERLDRERKAIETALERALAETKDEHSAEIEQLRARLAEAEANAERAVSRAQMTKSGHIYVISNIGSFGDDVFKIGMTRRLTPEDRVRELGDASVPFPFDVHMMISCDDAPALENALHRALHLRRVNKANPRKEYFRSDVDAIRKIVAEHHDGEINYVADPEALEYRQSQEMADEDMVYIDSVYDSLDDEEDAAGDA